MHFLVFDRPCDAGTFDQRLHKLRALFAQQLPPTLRMVAQFHIRTAAELLRKRDAIVAGGGEGLVLHLGSSHYRAEPYDDLLKFKPNEYDEAREIGRAHV